MTELRRRHMATYSYPGSLFPEEATREIPEPTFASAVKHGPDEDGYFSKDRWYAVSVVTITDKRFIAADGTEAWVKAGSKPVGKWVVGDRIHFSDIEQTDRNRILISNIECNSRDGGYGVLTRCGNWQIASDFTAIVEPEKALA